MEIALVFGVVMVIWFWVRSSAEKSREAADRAQSIRVFEMDNSDSTYTDTWTLPFEEMVLTRYWNVLDTPGEKKTRRWNVRRRDGGVWDWKYTSDSFSDEVNELNEWLKRPMLEREATEKLKKIDGNPWTPIPDEFAARLETGYQRFIRQG